MQLTLADGGSVSLLWSTEQAGPCEAGGAGGAGGAVLLLLPGINNDASMGYVQHVQVCTGWLAAVARQCRGRDSSGSSGSSDSSDSKCRS